MLQDKKTEKFEGLRFLNVLYTDASETSPQLFQITDFPRILTAGRNLFKLKGHPENLKVGSFVNIEILDSNGNPIYHEILDYIEEDKSRVVAIYIYDDTPPGDALITIVGTAKIIEGQQVPTDWQDQINVKWEKFVTVNPTLQNNSEIIYVTKRNPERLFEEIQVPQIQVTEQIITYLDREYIDGSQFKTYDTGSVTYAFSNNTAIITLDGGVFNQDMEGGTFTCTNPNNAKPKPLDATGTGGTKTINTSEKAAPSTGANPTKIIVPKEESPTGEATIEFVPITRTYTSKVKKVLSATTIELETPYQVSFVGSNATHTYTSFESSSYTISYEGDPEYISTQNSESFANVVINDLEPATGDTTYIKVYYKSKGAPAGDYNFLNEVEVGYTELLVDSSSLNPDTQIGRIKSQTTIDNYWQASYYEGTTIAGTPTLTFETSSIINAISVGRIAGKSLDPINNVTVLQNKDAYTETRIGAQTRHKITFDAYSQKNSNDTKYPVMHIYLSGSAFDFDSGDIYNQNYAKRFGKRIGTLRAIGNTQKFYEQEYEPVSDNSGSASILFVIETGDWSVSNIRMQTNNDAGYTPNTFAFRTQMPKTHKIGNQLDFKFEYYTANKQRSKQVTFVEATQEWEGGNLYIDGGSNLLTGSVYIGNAIGSGIELAGVASGYIRSLGYNGYLAATQGSGSGFIIYSGSSNLTFGSISDGTIQNYTGIGLELVSPNDTSHLIFQTKNGGLLDIKTEKFFIGTTGSQFISGSDGDIEISSSLFHLDPKNNLLVIGADAVINADLAVENIRTPALIGGSPSTTANASSSIESDGYARFVSASIGGFNISETQIFSTNENIILKSSGEITASQGFLFGDKGASQYIQWDAGSLVVRGDLSVDQIFTPALIGGSPANVTNASSSITSDGFAKFVSASIGGWSVNTGSIQGSNIIMLPEGTIQTRDFATNVKGWKISSLGNGTAEFENVRIRGTLSTTTFEKETVNAVGGQLYVANSTTISGSFYTKFNSHNTASLHGGSFPLFDTATISVNGSSSINIDTRVNGTTLYLATSSYAISQSYQLDYEVSASLIVDSEIIIGYSTSTAVSGSISTSNATYIDENSFEIEDININTNASDVEIFSTIQDESTTGIFTLEGTPVESANISWSFSSGTYTVTLLDGVFLTEESMSLANPATLLFPGTEQINYIGSTGVTASAAILDKPIDNFGSLVLSGSGIDGTYTIVSKESNTQFTIDTTLSSSGSIAATNWQINYINTGSYSTGTISIVSASQEITGSVSADATTFIVKNATGFVPNEILTAKKVNDTGFATEYMQIVTSSVFDPSGNDFSGTITVVRGYGSSSLAGLNPADMQFLGDLVSVSQSYEEGQVLASTGVIGTGYIRLNANPRDQSTPYIDIVERTGSGVYDVALKARLGDLSGLANSDYVFGSSNPGFGLATDNVFLQGGIIANTGSIAGVNMDAGKLYTGVGSWGNSNTGFYLDSNASMSLADKLTWDGTTLNISGVINIESGSGFATQADINTATGSLSSSIATSITTVSSSFSSSLSGVSGSIVNTISTVSGSIATDIASNVDKIVTDANNKIVKPNPAPSGDGLFLASTHMGYYDSSSWNAYISSSGEFLFKADDDNLISFGNSSFVLKVADQAVISGSQISLLTPNFFFGGETQFISGANSNIEISSSNFHLQPNGDVVIGGAATIEQGAVFGVLPALPSNEKLKVYIPFEEGGGTKVFNHANESEPLTIQSSSGFTRISGSNTAYGNSLFLEGTFLKFDSGNGASAIIHDGGTQVSQSIVVWLNTPSASISTPQIIYEQNGATNGQALFISNGMVYWSIFTSGGSNKQVVSASIDDSELTMIGATVNANLGQMKIYKNGFVQQVLNASITISGNNECGIGGVASQIRIISGSESGTVYNTDGALPYYGMIDEFRIYKEYLSDANMLALYQNPGGVSSTTKITGDNISTGQIKSNNLSSTQGTLIDLNGEVFKIGGTAVTPTSGEGIVLDGSVTGQPKFFVGDASSNYVRFGETAGALEISSSGFTLDTGGAVTATELQVISNGTTMIDTSTGFTDGTNVVRHLPFQTTLQQHFIARIPGENYIQVLFFTTADAGTATLNWYPYLSGSATGFGSLVTDSVTWGTLPAGLATNPILVRAVFNWSSFASEPYGRMSFTLSGVTNTADIQVIAYRNFQPEFITAQTLYIAT